MYEMSRSLLDRDKKDQIMQSINGDESKCTEKVFGAHAKGYLGKHLDIISQQQLARLCIIGSFTAFHFLYHIELCSLLKKVMVLYKVAGGLMRTALHKSNVGSLIMTQKVFSRSYSLDISGIYPPIVTTFDKEENIDWDSLKSNMDKWNKVPFKGYVVQGSNGEYAYMDSEERVKLVSEVKKVAGKGKLLIAGSGCESTKATVDMTNAMGKAGADAALVVTPCFYKSGMNDQAMISHFTRVADESSIPVILYSVPANTGLDLSSEVIIKLSAHPNIIGLKDSGGDISKLGYIVYKTANNQFQVLAGSASFLYAAYHVGCVGGVCALANVLGPQLCELEFLYNKGQYKEALSLQQRLIAPNMDVTRKFGVPGLKQAMEWKGYIGGPTRMPLRPLTKEQIQILRSDFETNGFL